MHSREWAIVCARLLVDYSGLGRGLGRSEAWQVGVARRRGRLVWLGGEIEREGRSIEVVGPGRNKLDD